jgi:magnesium-protoporphyrin IX monomethyl ester (oxidative) cyclase
VGFDASIVRVSPFIPLGLAYVAAALEKAGHEVRILDALIEGDLQGITQKKGYTIRYGLSDHEIIKRIREYNPDCVGVSCLFSAMERDAVYVCGLAKEVNRNISTVIGGAWAGTNKEKILKFRGYSVDYVIRGDGEQAILDIINHGFSRPRPIENLDTIPFPAYHLLPMQKYFDLAVGHAGYKQKPFMTMITSRGCKFACSFCSIANHWGKKPRYRSAVSVLSEIDFLVNQYGIREIHFEDDNLTGDRARAIQIFDGLIERNYGLTWTVPSGMAVSCLDDELLEKMAASGCYSVSLAIENGNQDICTKIMKKPINLAKVKPMVDKIRSLGMDVRGFFILGFPGEGKVDIENTIEFAKSLELDWSHFFVFSPLPGTEIYQTCIDRGWLDPNDFDPLRSFYSPMLKNQAFTHEYLTEAKERANIETNFLHNWNTENCPAKACRLFGAVVDMYPHLDFARKALEEAKSRA